MDSYSNSNNIKILSGKRAISERIGLQSAEPNSPPRLVEQSIQPHGWSAEVLFHGSDMSKVAMFCMNASGCLNDLYYSNRCFGVMDCMWSSPICSINYLSIYPIYVLPVTTSPKFHSVLLFDGLFSSYRPFWEKCTEWPQNDLEQY